MNDVYHITRGFSESCKTCLIYELNEAGRYHRHRASSATGAANRLRCLIRVTGFMWPLRRVKPCGHFHRVMESMKYITVNVSS